MHVFTSITANYLPKARVLAASLKRLHPRVVFHLVLADRKPDDFGGPAEPFDAVLTADDLPIPERPAWIFKHSVVELCTAVKGLAAVEIRRRFGTENLFYLDPDIAVLGPLDGLEALLARHSILLTPHLTAPEVDLEAIEQNEICALQHGVYNLGFVGVRADDEGRRFLEWWAHRLLHFCYDDVPGGLFTDQRWADLVPAFFPGAGIVREPQYNVAPWNVSRRRAEGIAPYNILIDGKPLAFFHFSGLDSGANEGMLKRYGADSPVLFKLREWYLAECERMGQSREGKRPCAYGFYEDGTPVPRAHRLLYRTRPDLQSRFRNPYATSDNHQSFSRWVGGNAGELDAITAVDRRVRTLEAELTAIRSSRTWRTARALGGPGRAFGLLKRGLRVCREQGVAAALDKLMHRLSGRDHAA